MELASSSGEAALVCAKKVTVGCGSVGHGEEGPRCIVICLVHGKIYRAPSARGEYC